MFTISHPSDSRGQADHGWLKSRYTFSFADYYNPHRMHFGALRVINDDLIEAGGGFETHPHRDMEIVSIPLEGKLEHQDSVGRHGVISKGEVQIMSAGTGIYHSEKNASNEESVKLLQIWVLPKKLGVTPRYEQKDFSGSDKDLTLIVAPDGRGGSLTINQEAFFSLAKLKMNQVIDYKLNQKQNGLYLFIINGLIEVNGITLTSRDGLGVTVSDDITIKSLGDSELLLMEVPMINYNL